MSTPQDLPPRLRLLLHAPPGRVIRRLAMPNVASVMLMTGVTFADAWFVGQLGTEALASLALVFPLQTLMQMMAAGAIGGGIASATARALGANDQARAEAVAWHAVLIAAALALVYTVVLGVFARPVFGLFGVSSAVQEGAVLYAHIAFGGAIGMWMQQTMFAILRGTGDTDTPAKAMMTASAVQIGLSGALTLGWGPVPAFGIQGPAIAMVVCLSLSGLYMAYHLMRAGERAAAVRLRAAAFKWAACRSILQVGGPGLLNSLTIALTVVAVTGFMAQYGTAALAGYGLGSRLELMLVPLAFGIGGALTAAVGANVGARQMARARRLAWTGASVTFAVTTVIGLAVAIWPELWLERFTANAEAFAMGGLYLAIAGPLYGLFAGGQTLYFASQGTGRMFWPVAVGVIRFGVAVGGSALAVSLAAPAEALYAAVAAGLATVGVGLALCVRFAPGWQGP